LPSRPSFMPLTLLGFYPSEVFPPDLPGLPLGAPAPLGVPRRRPRPARRRPTLLSHVFVVPGDPFPGRGLAPQAHGTPGWTTKAGDTVQDPIAHLCSSGTDHDDHTLTIPRGPAPRSLARRSREGSCRAPLRGGGALEDSRRGSQSRGSEEPLEGSPSGAGAGGWPTEGGPPRGSGEPH
jgi:hypothetical protein